MTGRIHSFASLGAVDGPGLRFVVFLQGCSLRCRYCHNPDTWPLEGGTDYTAGEVLSRILRVKPYFGESGGVTVSGGEPLLQAKFATELFALCHENGIRTCLDTSGLLLDGDVISLLSFTDLCLLDIKANTEEAYRSLCGMGLQPPLAFLKELERQKIPTWIRRVVVPNLNDDPRDIDALNALLAPFSCIRKVELLAFHTMCIEKYRKLGIPFPLEGTPPMDELKLLRLAEHLKHPH
jgi:pyruvate formate lyase activating enzyme